MFQFKRKSRFKYWTILMCCKYSACTKKTMTKSHPFAVCTTTVQWQELILLILTIWKGDHSWFIQLTSMMVHVDVNLLSASLYGLWKNCRIFFKSWNNNGVWFIGPSPQIISDVHPLCPQRCLGAIQLKLCTKIPQSGKCATCILPYVQAQYFKWTKKWNDSTR